MPAKNVAPESSGGGIDLRQELYELGRAEAEKWQAGRDHKVILEAGREAVYLTQFKSIIGDVLKEAIKPRKCTVKPATEPKTRILNFLGSDWHLGARLLKGEVPIPYGAVEEARRISYLLAQVVDYKRQYRADTKLYFHILGDMIQGQLHDPRDGAEHSEQMGGAISILTQATRFLSENFPEVEVFCTPGNHGRNTARHPNRAVRGKSTDSYETDLYLTLQSVAAQTWPNVRVHVAKTPYYMAQCFDQRGFFTHGDTVLMPGYPGRSINVAKIRQQINEINGSLTAKQRYSLFAVGHVHTATCVDMPGGVTFLSNGTTEPPDAYALSIGILSGSCSQWLYESTPGHIFGDSRLIRIDAKADKDRSLDSIIKPYHW